MAPTSIERDRTFRLLSIDPGSFFAGISISEIDEAKKEMVVIDSHTLDLDRVLRLQYPDLYLNQPDRVRRLRALYESVLHYLNTWRPVAVCCEGPYFRRRPLPFAVLVECVTTIRAALFEYDPDLVLTIVDPATVKKTLGVKGNSGDKDLIKKALPKQVDLKIIPNLKLMSEHACDSVGVGYYYFKKYTGGLK